MISIMFVLLCVFVLLLLVGLYTRRKIARNTMITVVMVWGFFLLSASLTMRIMLPTFSNRVTVEATREKNADSKGTDIGVTSIQTGGKRLDLDSGDVDRGTWQYNGTALSWGYTADSAFTFLAPCYADTKIEFIQNIWAGKVRVLSRDAEEILDLYAPNSSNATRMTYTIAREGLSTIARRMLPTAFLLLFELLLWFSLGIFWARKRPDAAQRIAKKWRGWKERQSLYFFLRLFIILVAFLTMWRFAGRWSLWADDFATISFVAEDVPLSTNITRILSEARYNPPLFYVFAYFWLRIMPYGTVYLRLLSILLCCAGIWFCGTAAKRIAGERASLIAAIFAATSYFLISHAAYAFRSFGLVFLLCPLLIISYHKRLTEPAKIRHYISYGLLHALLLYTNYICGLITAILGLYDLWLFAKKKIKFYFLWSYIGAGLAFLPLILYVLSAMIESHTNFWPSTPNLGVLMDAISQIFSGHIFFLSFFVFAVVLVFVAALRGTAMWKAAASGMEQEIIIALVLWFLFVIGFDYVFSRYLYPNSSIFVQRYFISVLTPAVIVAAIGMDWVLAALCEGRGKTTSDILICAAIVICYVCLEYSCLNSLRTRPGANYENYEQAIDWICAQEEAYQGKCVVVMTGYQGGLYYYATQGGKRPNLNFGNLNNQNWMDYDVVYVSPMHGTISSSTQSLLDKHYEEAERKNDLNVVKYRKK